MDSFVADVFVFVFAVMLTLLSIGMVYRPGNASFFQASQAGVQKRRCNNESVSCQTHADCSGVCAEESMTCNQLFGGSSVCGPTTGGEGVQPRPRGRAGVLICRRRRWDLRVPLHTADRSRRGRVPNRQPRHLRRPGERPVQPERLPRRFVHVRRGQRPDDRASDRDSVLRSYSRRWPKLVRRQLCASRRAL